jgi:hypothetical protein
VDIAYAPFIERFQPFLKDVKNYDITIGRPKLAAWIEVENTIKSYLFMYACLSWLLRKYFTIWEIYLSLH